jgi:hypothetical protein
MMPFSKLLTILLCTTLSISCGEVLQQRFLGGRGGLTGKVVDLEGVKTQALITLYYEDGPESFRMESDADGKFIINDLPSGNPQLVATDLFGNLAISRAVVCADEMIDIGTLRLQEVEKGDLIDIPAVIGRRITAGANVGVARISRSGKSIIYSVFDHEYNCMSDNPCKWYVIREMADGSWKSMGTLEMPDDTLIGLDDEWIYEKRDSRLWRIRIDDLETIEISDSFSNFICLDITIDGPLCYTLIDSKMSDESMPGDLMIWRLEDTDVSILVAREPNGMGRFPTLSPDGRRVAYAPRNQGEWTGNQRIIMDLTTGGQQLDAAENIVYLAFDPFGQLASLDIDSEGRIYFRSQPISKAVMLPVDAIVDLYSLYKTMRPIIFFDAYWQDWMAFVIHGEKLNMFHIKDETMSVTQIDSETIDASIWQINAQGNIAFIYDLNGYDKIFTTYSGSKYPLTVLNQDHRLLGWSSDGQSVIYIVQEPQSGRLQILSLRVPSSAKTNPK